MLLRCLSPFPGCWGLTLRQSSQQLQIWLRLANWTRLRGKPEPQTPLYSSILGDSTRSLFKEEIPKDRNEHLFCQHLTSLGTLSPLTEKCFDGKLQNISVSGFVNAQMSPLKKCPSSGWSPPPAVLGIFSAIVTLAPTSPQPPSQMPACLPQVAL